LHVAGLQVASGKWQVASGKWQVASGKWRREIAAAWQSANFNLKPATLRRVAVSVGVRLLDNFERGAQDQKPCEAYGGLPSVSNKPKNYEHLYESIFLFAS